MKELWCLLLSAIGALSIENDFKGFDDTILFGIEWPGALDNLQISDDTWTSKYKDLLQVTTSHKEKYECHIPELKDEETQLIDEYEGPSPINLLKPLFTQKVCSYRLESYWSYEICHGRYIRQYHDERNVIKIVVDKKIRTQEYFLGHWNAQKQLALEEDLKVAAESKAKPKTIKVEGLTLPYVEIAMDEGTLCDLNEKPRTTRVLYVCYSHGKHEVYSFKETSTCQYEVVILSPLLCEHPQFKPKDVSENIIKCLPLAGAPKKPRNMLKNEVESFKFNTQPEIKFLNNEKDANDVLAVLKVEKIEKDGETHLKFELHPLNEEDQSPGNKPTPLIEKAKALTDDSPARAFLNGQNCLNGGTGWWKYEFCYGKHVVQYHVDRAGEKTTLVLGKFNEKAHLEWIRSNRGKAPKPVEQRTSVSHFYSGGDICDKTNKPRQTEVKLKCLENSSSPAQVSLYLLEPRTCHYILGVESPLLCDILPLADDNGLINLPKLTLEAKDSLTDKKVEEDDVKEKDVHKVLD